MRDIQFNAANDNAKSELGLNVVRTKIGLADDDRARGFRRKGETLVDAMECPSVPATTSGQ